MENAIKLAIEGGWNEKDWPDFWPISDKISWSLNRNLVGISLLFWQALGKSLGWPVSEQRKTWKNRWHQFIDHLAAGKSADSFFESLISTK